MSLASDHEESLPIAETQVTALYLADYWEKLPSTIELLGRLREQGSRPREVHTDDELLGLEAQWRLGADIQGLFTQLSGCVDSRAPREHRVRAAMLALMLADNLCSHAAAQSLYTAIQPHVDSPDVQPITRTYFRMIYSCSFGDALAAPALARELIAQTRAHGNAATLSRNLRHASIAFEVGGMQEEAEAAIIEAFNIAEQLGLENAATGAIASLVGLYTRLGQISDAESWHRRAMNHRAPYYGAINYSNLIGFKVKLAIQNGWYDDAEYLIDLANRNLSPGASLRHRAEISAQRLHLAMMRDGRPPDAAAVDELMDIHISARGFNWHDYVAAVLFEALLALGQGETSTKLATEYITQHRRGRSPLLPELADCLYRLNVLSQSVT
jgi:hypothetical protein